MGHERLLAYFGVVELGDQCGADWASKGGGICNEVSFVVVVAAAAWHLGPTKLHSKLAKELAEIAGGCIGKKKGEKAMGRLGWAVTMAAVAWAPAQCICAHFTAAERNQRAITQKDPAGS